MARPLKVLILCETGGPGGAERVVAELAICFRDREIPCAVATFRSGWLTEELDRLGVERYLIETKAGFDPLLPWRIRGVIRKCGATVLHTHLLDANFYGAIGARLAGVKHLATEHGDVHHTDSKKLLGLKIRIINLLRSHFTAVSAFSAQKLIALGARLERVHVVRNPSDIYQQLVAASTKRDSIRQTLGIPSHHWVWVHVANLRPVKDQDTLIRGFASALSASDDQTLLIVGDGPEREKLERLIASLGIDRNVILAGFQQDVPSHLIAADGFILSSRSEAMPMSLLEAAQAELVLVGSSVGGIPECLADGRGYLFPAGSVQGLATQLKRILGNVEEARDSALFAADWVRNNCSHETITKELLRLYSGKATGTHD